MLRVENDVLLEDSVALAVHYYTTACLATRQQWFGVKHVGATLVVLMRLHHVAPGTKKERHMGEQWGGWALTTLSEQ